MSEDVCECYKCGFDNSLHGQESGGYVEFYCVKCGTLNQIHLSPVISESLYLKERRFLVKVVWAGGKASLAEMKALQEIVPDFKIMSSPAVKMSLSDSSCYEFGVYPSVEARSMRKSLEAKGFAVLLEEFE